MFRPCFVCLLFLCVVFGLRSQSSLGIFSGQSDVGAVLHPGSVDFDASTSTYTVSGSGENMWLGKDEFYFVYRKIDADELTFTADITPLEAAGNPPGNPHRKGVLMIRQSLDPDSPYVDAARHAEGLTSLQFRDRKGAVTHELEANVSGPSTLRIEKRGSRFYLWIAAHSGDELDFAGGSAWVEMHAPFYIGLGVCSHDKQAVEKFAFSHVDLNTRPKRPKKGSYSTVETVLLSGDARTAVVSHKHLTSPGWNADGTAITFQEYITRQQAPFLPLRTAAPVKPPVPVVVPDFTYFTSHSGATEQIWRRTSDGSQSDQFTPDDFNNVAPHLSPDGKSLLFLSYSREYSRLSDGIPVDLRLMTLADTKIRTLASFIGGPESLGPQPWSPDGQRIVFISYQAMANLNLKF